MPENLAGKFRTTGTIIHFAQWGLLFCRTLYAVTRWRQCNGLGRVCALCVIIIIIIIIIVVVVVVVV